MSEPPACPAATRQFNQTECLLRLSRGHCLCFDSTTWRDRKTTDVNYSGINLKVKSSECPRSRFKEIHYDEASQPVFTNVLRPVYSLVFPTRQPQRTCFAMPNKADAGCSPASANNVFRQLGKYMCHRAMCTASWWGWVPSWTLLCSAPDEIFTFRFGDGNVVGR